MNDQQFIRQANSLIEDMKKTLKTGMLLKPAQVSFILECIKEAVEYRKIPKSKD
jgi:hydroxymethylpyrimidine/phosphomethylpyrimidine kinase